MADATTPQLDAAAVRRLVEEVLRRIAAGQPAATAATPAAAPPAPVAPAVVTAAITVADAVITLAHIERLPAGSRRVVVSARAVITPSARDRAREAGIAIERAGSGGAATPVVAQPFVIAHAECRGDVAGRAAAITRAVPQAQLLPATGLADVVSALALHASRDAARGVLITSRPALAMIVANRSASLRAVTGRDAASLAAAAADCGANLLVVDPAAFAGGLERACAEFAGRAAGAIPAELGQAPSGCACQSHPH